MDGQTRPKPQPIDPKKFVGGQNLEKFKGILKDVDEFTGKAKVRLKEVDGMIDRFHEIVGKFDTTIEAFKKLVELNGEAFRRMMDNLKEGANYIAQGGTHGRREQDERD